MTTFSLVTSTFDPNGGSESIIPQVAGSLLVAIISERSGYGALSGVTDNNGGTWAQVLSHEQEMANSNARHSMQVWWRVVRPEDVGVTIVVSVDDLTVTHGLTVAQIAADTAYDWTPATGGTASADSGTAHWDGLSSGLTSNLTSSDLFVFGVGAARQGGALTAVSLSPMNFAQSVGYGGTNQVTHAHAMFEAGQAGGTKSTTVASDGSGAEGIAAVVVFQNGASASEAVTPTEMAGVAGVIPTATVTAETVLDPVSVLASPGSIPIAEASAAVSVALAAMLGSAGIVPTVDATTATAVTPSAMAGSAGVIEEASATTATTIALMALDGSAATIPTGSATTATTAAPAPLTGSAGILPRPDFEAAASAIIAYPTGDAGSAEFDGAIDAGWATAGPAFDGFSVEDGRLKVAFDAADNYDPGTANDNAGSNAPRVETDAPAGDFDVFTMLSSDPKVSDANYAGMGFHLRTASSAARLELYTKSDERGSRVYIKHGSTTVAGTVPNNPANNTEGFATHLRLSRAGDVFTFSASFDGSTWQQIASFTWAVTLTKVGVHFMQLTPSTTGTTFFLDHVHFGQQALPTVAANVSRTTQLDESFADLSAWSDDSANGGAASVSGGVLTLSCTGTDQSTGRIISNATFGEHQGMTFRVRRSTAMQADIYFGVAVRGQGAWAGQYAPDVAFLYEGNHQSNLVRLLRSAGPRPTAADGADFTYLYSQNVADAQIDDWTWIRLEAVGPHFRYRVWDDGAIEPETWTGQVVDGAVRGEGKVGFALSHNDGIAVSGSVEIAEPEIYTIAAGTEAAEPASLTALVGSPGIIPEATAEAGSTASLVAMQATAGILPQAEYTTGTQASLTALLGAAQVIPEAGVNTAGTFGLAGFTGVSGIIPVAEYETAGAVTALVLVGAPGVMQEASVTVSTTVEPEDMLGSSGIVPVLNFDPLALRRWLRPGVNEPAGIVRAFR